MEYTPEQIEKTRIFMASARKKGLENEARTGRNSGGGLTQEQRSHIDETVKAAEGLYLDARVKQTLLERFVMWSEHHGSKVENEQHPYILRQLIEEYMKNDDWMSSGYDGKTGATVRGVICEKVRRIDPSLPTRQYSSAAVAAKQEAPTLPATVTAEEAEQYLQNVRAGFKASGHTLRGTTTSSSAQVTNAVDQFAAATSFNKFTLRHLLATFGKMANYADMKMSDGMATAILPTLAAELAANKAFLKAADNTGMIPLTAKQGDVGKDIQKEFPFLCEKAPEIVRRAVLMHSPHKEHLQKVMQHFEQMPPTIPEKTRLYNAGARASAEYRHKPHTPRENKAGKPDADKGFTAEPTMPSWLSPVLPSEDAASHLTRIIQGDWSKHDGRSGGRKK